MNPTFEKAAKEFEQQKKDLRLNAIKEYAASCKKTKKKCILKEVKPERVFTPREEYQRLVHRLTKEQDLSVLPGIEKRGFDYHLDHIISISDGFHKGIKPEVIASISNLRIIPREANMHKNRHSEYAAHPLAGLIVPLR